MENAPETATERASGRRRVGENPEATPGWVSQVTDTLLEAAEEHAEADWSRRLHEESHRLEGRVRFSVMHDWYCTSVGPLLAEAAARRDSDAGAQETVRLLHERALAGEKVTEDTWRAALEPALREVYRLAYAYSEAYERASAAASSFAVSRGQSEAEAREYGELYAHLNTEASARVHAEANAAANAAALASAFASADAKVYASAWPGALVRAWTAAYAGEESEDGVLRREAIVRLGSGLADALERAQPQ
jgi:hypothetical protein